MKSMRIFLSLIVISLIFSNNYKFNQPFIDVAKNANPSIVSVITEVEYTQRQINPFFNAVFISSL